MSDRRCPTCGALVTADAEWCSQCFASLVESKAPPPSGDVPPPPPAPGHVPPPPPAGAPPHAGGPAHVSTADIPKMPGAPAPVASRPPPTWTCPVCRHENPLEVDPCAMCGTPFAHLFREQTERRSVDPGAAVARSLAFPGLGHRLAGWGGDGLVRGGLFVFTLVMMGLLLLGRAGKPMGPVLPMIGILLLVAVAIYLFAAVEAHRLAQGGGLLVPRKTMTWVASGIVVVVFLLSLLIVSTAVRNR